MYGSRRALASGSTRKGGLALSACFMTYMTSCGRKAQADRPKANQTPQSQGDGTNSGQQNDWLAYIGGPTGNDQHKLPASPFEALLPTYDAGDHMQHSSSAPQPYSRHHGRAWLRAALGISLPGTWLRDALLKFNSLPSGRWDSSHSRHKNITPSTSSGGSAAFGTLSSRAPCDNCSRFLAASKHEGEAEVLSYPENFSCIIL